MAEDDFRKALEASLITAENERSERERIAEEKIVELMDEDQKLEFALQQSLEEEFIPADRPKTIPELWEIAAGPSIRKYRRFVGCPENAGGLVVGSKFRHSLRICSEVGNNCLIQFLPEKRIELVRLRNEDDGIMPACLVIQADTDDAAEMAEVALQDRIADLFDRVQPQRQNWKILQQNVWEQAYQNAPSNFCPTG